MSEKRTKVPRTTRKRQPQRLRPIHGDSRIDILEAAISIFATQTFEGASLQEIAKLAGVGRPLINYHFESKERLWEEAVDYCMRGFQTVFGTISAAAVDLEPIQAINVLVRSFVQFASEHNEHALLLTNEIRLPGPRFDWIIEKYLRPVHDYMDAMVLRGIERGQLKPIKPYHLTTLILPSISHFFMVRPMLTKIYGIEPKDPEVTSEHAEFLIETIFNGLRLQPQPA